MRTPPPPPHSSAAPSEPPAGGRGGEGRLPTLASWAGCGRRVPRGRDALPAMPAAGRCWWHPQTGVRAGWGAFVAEFIARGGERRKKRGLETSSVSWGPGGAWGTCQLATGGRANSSGCWNLQPTVRKRRRCAAHARRPLRQLQTLTQRVGRGGATPDSPAIHRLSASPLSAETV